MPSASHLFYGLTTLLITAYVSFADHKLSKDGRCHMLMNPGCDVSMYRILDYEEAGWFYHAPFRSCRPFYAPAGSLCQQNRDLPLTKEACDEICGEYCELPDGSEGLCMMEGSCDIDMPASWNPRPCHAYNVQCCPKSSSAANAMKLGSKTLN